jgi:hypothetical protein
VSELVVWRDALHEGPVPAAGDAELRAARDAQLAAGREGDYVLWFEADLYDQLQLAQILSQLAALTVAPERITLICIGEHLGRARFGGLGELTADELAALPARAAVALTPDALALATRAWDALRAPDPGGIETIVAARSPVLRFLPEAFDRLAREYPSTRDGLSLTERRLLAAVADGATHARRGVPAGDGSRGPPLPRRHVGLRDARALGQRTRAAAGRPAADHDGCRCARAPGRGRLRRAQWPRPLGRRRAPRRT